MKTNYLSFKALAVALLFTATGWSQATIALWNFNGTSNTTVSGGATSPSTATGDGTALLVGGTTATFANGSNLVGTAETETTSPPNYGWNTTGYPPTGTGSKTAGVQFNINTTGYTGITMYFEQRTSNTSANTYVVQYTENRLANPVVWVDSQTFTFTPTPDTGDTWRIRELDFSGINTLSNNPNAAFRVVSAFDPGAGNYLSANSGSTYAGGTVRYDMVRFTGTTLSTPGFDAASRFSMSPNPSRGQIVNFNQSHDIEVFDITGKLIHKATDATFVDARAFSPGVYVVKTGAGFARKLIVE